MRRIWRHGWSFWSGGGASCLWPRWLLLRGVGLIYVVMFVGIMQDEIALNGPNGLIPIGEFLRHVAATSTGFGARFLAAPTLFWLGGSPEMILAVAGLGLAAAVALVLNLWPRLALFVCWLSFLSFVAIWNVFSAAQLDRLMVETALICIPFAPRGFRPGLGAASPPRPVALFMMRWLLFRVMFESGLVKLTAGDPHWRDFSAMDIMYETSPFPTVLGYLDHHLSRAYHVGEILFTFFAELVAPGLAVCGGRRGRWVAFGAWSLFQIGIQLTNNFGWLNVASFALGLLLLDDGMLRSAARALRLERGWSARANRAPAEAVAPRVSAPWRGQLVRFGLGAHFALTGFFLAKAAGLAVYDVSPTLTHVVRSLATFRSANEYSLYARLTTERHEVEFLGSNDGGKTWRAYEYRSMPQFEETIPPFIAPRFVRFDASLEIAGWEGRPARIFPLIASHLLRPNPAVVGLFRRDPFPDRPPTVVRMRAYRLTFTSLAEQRATGRYWHKEVLGDYQPALRTDEQGRIGPFDLAAGEAALRRGDLRGALLVFEQDYQAGSRPAGYRLVELYSQGPEARAHADRSLTILREMAGDGELAAAANLGVLYETGLAGLVDRREAAHWYRGAARRGHPVATYRLGVLYAHFPELGHGDVEALALLGRALARSAPDARSGPMIRAQQPAEVLRLEARMTPADRAAAARLAANWPEGFPPDDRSGNP